jgi:hypothetical protein
VLDTTLALFNRDQFISAIAADMQISPFRVVITAIQEIEDEFCPECVKAEVVFPNYLIPAQVTTYVTFGLKLPTDAYRHIIRIEPIIDNDLMLHHIVVYISGQVPSANPVVENMPKNVRPLYAWAPGGDNVFDLPPEAGFNVGSDPTKDYYLVLSNHYNNPTKLTDQRDSSGMRVYLNTPRPENASFLFFGNIGGINIPPDSNFYRQGSIYTIPVSITKQVQLFSSFPHMHSHGQKIWLVRRRTGSPDIEYGKILAWDYNSQRTYPEDDYITGGDVLYTQCLFNTVGETSRIYGGEATTEEMCLVGLAYYPDVGIPGLVLTQSYLSPQANCDYPCAIYT